jgi:hypothetical protein
MVKGQKGGSFTSDKVNKSSTTAAQEAIDDIFNLTKLPTMTGGITKLVGGGKKSKKHTGRKSQKRSKGKKAKQQTKKAKGKGCKMTKGAKKKSMRGGGVLNVGYGCGFVNTADLGRHGCDPEKVRNPPMLGTAGSGVVSVDGHAGV